MIAVSDLRKTLRLTHTRDDDQLVQLRAAAVAELERWTGLYLGPVEQVTRTVAGTGSRNLWLRDAILGGAYEEDIVVLERVHPGDDPTEILAADSSGYVVGETRLERRGGSIWTYGYQYEVTYYRGFESEGTEPDDYLIGVPEDLRRKCRELVVYQYEHRDPGAEAGTLDMPAFMGAVRRIFV